MRFKIPTRKFSNLRLKGIQSNTKQYTVTPRLNHIYNVFQKSGLTAHNNFNVEEVC